MFGRGGEEALALKEHGIPVHEVPGVTSGIGLCGMAGIPVTQGCKPWISCDYRTYGR